MNQHQPPACVEVGDSSFERLLEFASGAIAVVDRQAVIGPANRQAEAVFGWGCAPLGNT